MRPAALTGVREQPGQALAAATANPAPYAGCWARAGLQNRPWRVRFPPGVREALTGAHAPRVANVGESPTAHGSGAATGPRWAPILPRLRADPALSPR